MSSSFSFGMYRFFFSFASVSVPIYMYIYVYLITTATINPHMVGRIRLFINCPLSFLSLLSENFQGNFCAQLCLFFFFGLTIYISISISIYVCIVKMSLCSTVQFISS